MNSKSTKKSDPGGAQYIPRNLFTCIQLVCGIFLFFCVCTHIGSKTLEAALKRVQDEIKRYAHVNKKAADQFMDYSDQVWILRLSLASETCFLSSLTLSIQRKSLLARVQGIDASKQAIDKLIEVHL